jgi:hypothetical protein
MNPEVCDVLLAIGRCPLVTAARSLGTIWEGSSFKRPTRRMWAPVPNPTLAILPR